MGKEKRTAAALTENPARALVATLLEVLKFTCKVVKRERERENTFCQHHYQRNREFFSDRIRDNEKEVRFVTDCISMTNSKTALFSSAKRDVSTTASPIKHFPTSRARSIYARECDVAFPFATSHQKPASNNTLLIRAKIIFFAVLA